MSRLVRLLSVVSLVVLLIGSAEAAHRIALQGNGKLAIVEKNGEIITLLQALWDDPMGAWSAARSEVR